MHSSTVIKHAQAYIYSSIPHLISHAGTILKLLQVLGVHVSHPARILLLEGANDPSSCMRQNT